MALEMVPTSADVLGSDIPLGTVGCTNSGVTELLQFCSVTTCQTRATW